MEIKHSINSQKGCDHAQANVSGQSGLHFCDMKCHSSVDMELIIFTYQYNVHMMFKTTKINQYFMFKMSNK